MLPKIIIIAVLVSLGVFFIAGSYFKDNPPQFQKSQPQHQGGSKREEPDLGAGVGKPFYSKDGLYLTHSWPGENNFSNEETEILLFNESSSNVEVKSFDLIYSVEGKTYPHKSGTWEKFPSKTSWDRTEYLNISAQHYQDQLLALARGEKGKLHWHINFDPTPLDGKQTVTVKLILLKDGQTITIGEQFNRDSGTVFSKDEH